MSHPVWVCGLKHISSIHYLCDLLSHPVWVCGLKLSHFCPKNAQFHVTPCMGVWIETSPKQDGLSGWRSHPVWVCGLKLRTFANDNKTIGHTLYGCVDWNWLICGLISKTAGHTLYGCVDWNRSLARDAPKREVTPCMGVWIETSVTRKSTLTLASHPVWVCGLKLIILNGY